MDEAPQLQLHTILQLTWTSLRCLVRCVACTVHVGDTVDLVPAQAPDLVVAAGLRVSTIEIYQGIPLDFLDPGRTGEVIVTGDLDGSAVRAAAFEKIPGNVVSEDLRLVVAGPR